MKKDLVFGFCQNSDDFYVYGVFRINFVNIANDLDRFFAIPNSLLNHLFLRKSGTFVRLGSIFFYFS